MITHKGIVKEVRDHSVLVSIDSETSCSACHSKGSCLVADTARKDIEIFSPGKEYETGSEVTVMLKETMGFKAVLLGYLLPFIVLMAALFTGTALSGNELTGGLVALFFVGMYYITLFFFRHHLKKVFKFELQENSYS